MECNATLSNCSNVNSSNSTLKGAEWFVRKTKDALDIAEVETSQEAFQSSLLAAPIANNLNFRGTLPLSGGVGSLAIASTDKITGTRSTPSTTTPFTILAVKVTKETLSMFLDPKMSPPIILGLAIN